MGLRLRVILLRVLMVAVLPHGLLASPANKGHPKSIPHHAAHILADPNHNSPRLLSLPTAQRLVSPHSHGGSGLPLSGHGSPYHRDDHLFHNSNHHPDYYNGNRGAPYNNGLYHNSIGGSHYNPGQYRNGRDYYNNNNNNGGYNGFGYNPYGVHPGGSYYIQLPDGRVEETSRVAAQLGYYPAGGHHDPYRG